MDLTLSHTDSRRLEVLVELSMAGDAIAFDRLYRQWHPRWLRFCTRLTGDSQDAADVLQEGALQIAMNINRLRSPSLFVAWAFTILRRRAVDRIRTNARHRTLESALEAESRVYDAPEQLTQCDDDLARMMAQLSDEQANLVTLFYVYGLSVSELASVFDLPVGTIKSRLHGARRELRTFLEHEREIHDE